jgi:acyl carrier protein
MSVTAWDSDAISEHVSGFLRESFLMDKAPLDADEELIHVLDSLQLLRMVMELEGAFGIRVDYRELTLENLGTLRRIATFVGAKLNP